VPSACFQRVNGLREMRYALLCAAVVFNVAAYGLFRSIASRPHDSVWLTLFACGLALGALNLFCFTIALKHLSLAVAYPVFSGATIGLMVALSAVIFKEQVTWTMFAGCTVIVAGIALLTRQ
jgi:multidrug transporter EmrE-like cation transporter